LYVAIWRKGMQTKLTLRLEEELIRKAKRFSKKTGKSVSRIVADYFEKLEAPSSEEGEAITPKVAALRGILKRTDVGEEDYYRYLEEKHL
jgi:hypothetical protein